MPRLAEVRLGLLRDVARVARVRLLRDRIEDRADERIVGCAKNGSIFAVVGVRDHHHVGRVDRLPAADRRSVERDAVLEEALVEAVDRDRRVLPHAREIDELEVDELDVVLLRELDDFLRLHGSCSRPDVRSRRRHCRQTARRQMASLPRSPVRMRTASSIGDDEDLPVADAPGLRALLDRVEHVVHELVGHDDLDLHLRHEVDDVRRAPVDLFLAAGATEALHLGDGHALHADLGEGVLHLVELERLDDGFDLLHASSRARRADGNPPRRSHASLVQRSLTVAPRNVSRRVSRLSSARVTSVERRAALPARLTRSRSGATRRPSSASPRSRGRARPLGQARRPDARRLRRQQGPQARAPARRRAWRAARSGS